VVSIDESLEAAEPDGYQGRPGSSARYGQNPKCASLGRASAPPRHGRGVSVQFALHSFVLSLA
jgi:hypothetical protein